MNDNFLLFCFAFFYSSEVICCYMIIINNINKIYLSGIKRDECVAPIPGRPCLTGLYVIENSPK